MSPIGTEGRNPQTSEQQTWRLAMARPLSSSGIPMMLSFLCGPTCSSTVRVSGKIPGLILSDRPVGVNVRVVFDADYNTPQTLNFQEPPLHKPKFLSFARREIQLWEEIYVDFLAVIPNLLVLHFEVNKSTFTTTCHSLTGQTNYRMQKRISWGPWR